MTICVVWCQCIFGVFFTFLKFFEFFGSIGPKKDHLFWKKNSKKILVQVAPEPSTVEILRHLIISPLRIPLYNVENNCKIVERTLWIIDNFSSTWSIIHHERTERKGIRKFYKRLLSTKAMTVMMKGQGKKTLERFRGLSSTLAGVRLGGLELWLGAWWWWWWWGWWWRWWWLRW